MLRNLKTKYFAIIATIFGLVACTSSEESTVHYTAVSKRDTARLKLTLFEGTFYGKLVISKPGDVVDSGEVRGKIMQDTLLGDNYYRPYGAKQKKRRPFVLLHRKDAMVQGTGIQKVYLGIPYFEPGTIDFDSAKFVFYPEKPVATSAKP